MSESGAEFGIDSKDTLSVECTNCGTRREHRIGDRVECPRCGLTGWRLAR